MSKNRCQYKILNSNYSIRRCKNYIHAGCFCNVHCDVLHKQQQQEIACENFVEQQCQQEIACENFVEQQHHDASLPTIEINTLDDINREPEYSICCFCDEHCNPCSQSCGRCAREMTMKMLGWK